MSTSARLFFAGSIVVTGLTVYAVNYYLTDETKRKRANIFADISRKEEQRRSNIEQYEKQLQLDQQLRLRDKE
ncbi:unnamed protein product [Adineta steineri]|uniref:Uncharacterized protein n=1 Tax=Adineta steineri TaxID=433720 RepID=A0A818RUB8_9BILA|nr:unnamed protein product [Adineta steineri]CAF1340373.1 unnamed protein product [Adineta steineri]CAF1403473.1 unnamed protein product [Adineta steineri]CAF1448685.1 unnamed protein product [Adineta steineri]CAF1615056.1 unnamed protein product [Adineta steineri]